MNEQTPIRPLVYAHMAAPPTGMLAPPAPSRPQSVQLAPDGKVLPAGSRWSAVLNEAVPIEMTPTEERQRAHDRAIDEGNRRLRAAEVDPAAARDRSYREWLERSAQPAGIAEPISAPDEALATWRADIERRLARLEAPVPLRRRAAVRTRSEGGDHPPEAA